MLENNSFTILGFLFIKSRRQKTIEQKSLNTYACRRADIEFIDKFRQFRLK
jgi:hypothetical protein